MKTLLSYLVIVVCFVNLAFTKALAPTQIAPLYDHLYEVNPLWALEDASGVDWCQELQFSDDTERIRMHLEMVEQLLLQADVPPSTERHALIETLALYREARRYPQNHYHSTRRPYFIDNHGTACAVGHLLQQSGNGAFAQQISQEMNFAYLKEMPYPEIQVWADQHGFLVEELALIQPGYPPSTSWAPLGTGANDEVTALHVDESNNRLIIAGKFTELDQISCQQVGVYADNVFSPLGNGVSGEIHAITNLGNEVFLGGEFENGNNIAIWDGTQWSYEAILVGAVHALHTWQGEVIAGGEFESLGGGTQTNYLARRQGGIWESFGWDSGPVYAIAEHEGQLVAGGNIDVNSLNPHYVSILDETLGWQALTDSANRLDNVVYDLASQDGSIFAAGGCLDTNDSLTFCLARLDTGQWTPVVQYDNFFFPNQAIKLIVPRPGSNSVLIGGNLDYWGMISGRGLILADWSFGFTSLEGYTALDSSVNAAVSFDGEFIVGGAFQAQQVTKPRPYLIRQGEANAIDDELSQVLSIWPNPIGQEAKGELKGNHRIADIHLFDLQGKRLPLGAEVRDQTFTIHRGDLPSGLYFLQIHTESGAIAQQKILFQ